MTNSSMFEYEGGAIGSIVVVATTTLSDCLEELNVVVLLIV